MQQEIYEVVRERFHLQDQNIYILQGTFPREFEVEAYLDEQKLACWMEPWENNSVLVRTQNIDLKKGEDVTVNVKLPEKLSDTKQLKIYAVSPAKRKKKVKRM